MLDLSDELHALPSGDALDAARSQALQLEQRRVFSVRNELLVALYVAVATLVAGVGLLVRDNLDRIGPLALLTAILAAAALCYAVAFRAFLARRERALGEDYILLLAALLFSTAIAYAELQFHVFGSGWSRHLLLLAVWHIATAYVLRSRLVLAVGLTAFAAWLGVEARLGTLSDPPHLLLGIGPRSLLCAAAFYLGSRLHRAPHDDASSGFREVYRQFAAHFGFWGALALGAEPATRWIGVLTLVALAAIAGRFALAQKRESFLIYAVGYSAIGLVWLEALIVRDDMLASWLGLATVIGATVLLFSLRTRLKESAQ